MAYWANTDALWLSLSPTQKAAAMALMEADARDPQGAVNALGAMINRAQKDGQPLDKSVSGKIYQPTIEDSQRARLQSIVQDPTFQRLDALAQARLSGQAQDWVGGATHFLAHPKVMLDLEAREPGKYRSWRQWSGYDPQTGQYANTVMTDKSHVFLAPEGKAGGGALAPMQTAATANEDQPMFDLFRMLGKSGADMNGLQAAGMAAPSLPSTPSAADEQDNPFGSLGLLAKFGGGQGGGSADMKLAQNAMQNATGGQDEGGMSPQRLPSFDIGKLQMLLKQVGQLGAGTPRRTA